VFGRQGLPSRIQAFGCEPERADDAYRSLTSGQLQSLESKHTIADGLRASLPRAPRTSPSCATNIERILLASEDEIYRRHAHRMGAHEDHHRPSSAVAIAPLLKPDAVGA